MQQYLRQTSCIWKSHFRLQFGLRGEVSLWTHSDGKYVFISCFHCESVVAVAESIWVFIRNIMSTFKLSVSVFHSLFPETPRCWSSPVCPFVYSYEQLNTRVSCANRGRCLKLTRSVEREHLIYINRKSVKGHCDDGLFRDNCVSERTKHFFSIWV